MSSGIKQTGLPPEKRIRRSVTRFTRHIVRLDALRAMIFAAVGLLVVVRVGSNSAVGETALVVIGTLVSYILLPAEPAKFWKIRSTDLATTVPPSELHNAGRETVTALAMQTGGQVGETTASLLWNDAFRSVTTAVSEPRRLVIDMDYRITVAHDHGRQLVRASVGGRRCWPGLEIVFFSFCSDVVALTAEYASSNEGSIAREIVELEEGENLKAWERRVASYPVSLVIDGKEHLILDRETRRFTDSSMCHRVRFEISKSRIREHFTPMQLTTEFHQTILDRRFIVKFSNYFCLGSTLLTFEVDDPSAIIEVNDFMLDASWDVDFYKRSGIATCQIALQTSENSVLRPGSGVVFGWRPGELLGQIPPSLHMGNLPEGVPNPDLPKLPAVLLVSEDRPEPLQEVSGLRYLDAYFRLGISSSPRPLRLRESVIKRLRDAQADLPAGFELIILDGWRSPQFQKFLISYYTDAFQSKLKDYIADPASTTMRPPHVVGGAVDLTLGYRGTPLELGSRYDDFSDLAHFGAFETIDSSIRRLRRMLSSALLANGFAPYPLEWWHWSYGDDVWASFKGCQPIYDVIDEHR